MSQHDINISNQSFPSFRGDLNNALEAISSLQSGANAPSNTIPYMLWADTSNNTLKIRNANNNNWIIMGELNASGMLLLYNNNPTGQVIPKYTGQLCFDTNNKQMFYSVGHANNTQWKKFTPELLKEINPETVKLSSPNGCKIVFEASEGTVGKRAYSFITDTDGTFSINALQDNYTFSKSALKIERQNNNNLKTTLFGDLYHNDLKLYSPNLLEEIVITNPVPNIILDINNNLGYKQFFLTITTLLTDTDNTSIIMRTSYDGGNNFLDGNGDYQILNNNINNNQSYIPLTNNNYSNISYSFLDGHISFNNLHTVSRRKIFKINSVYFDNTGKLINLECLGCTNNNYAINAIQLKPNTGNLIGGIVRIYGLK